ncbi:MAG: hypothetical protein ACFFC7_21265 [Candidatus Hermodarchaeota archaeon]
MTTLSKKETSIIGEFQYDFGNWIITTHNRNQFDLRIDYHVNPKAESSRFKVEMYFFIPRSFHINARTYTKDKFFEDMQAYIRFIPIAISLDKIIDRHNAISPLKRALDLLEDLHEGDNSQKTSERAVHELKMLSNIVTLVS